MRKKMKKLFSEIPYRDRVEPNIIRHVVRVKK